MIKDPTAVSQRLMWIVWPAFLMAGVLEAVVFARISRSLTMLLAMSPFKVNRCHLPLATCHLPLATCHLPPDSRRETCAADCPRQ